MDRKEFLSLIGIGTAAVVCGACFDGCAKDNNSVAAAPTNVDFTLDLSTSTYSKLNTVGQYVYKDKIIVACTGENSGVKTYAALSMACTHEGKTVLYQGSPNNRFHCNTHGSNFSTTGTVVNGPASKPLKKYNTSLNGSLLRVYS